MQLYVLTALPLFGLLGKCKEIFHLLKALVNIVIDGLKKNQNCAGLHV